MVAGDRRKPEERSGFSGTEWNGPSPGVRGLPVPPQPGELPAGGRAGKAEVRIVRQPRTGAMPWRRSRGSRVPIVGARQRAGRPARARSHRRRECRPARDPGGGPRTSRRGWTPGSRAVRSGPRAASGSEPPADMILLVEHGLASMGPPRGGPLVPLPAEAHPGGGTKADLPPEGGRHPQGASRRSIRTGRHEEDPSRCRPGSVGTRQVRAASSTAAHSGAQVQTGRQAGDAKTEPRMGPDDQESPGPRVVPREPPRKGLSGPGPGPGPGSGA